MFLKERIVMHFTFLLIIVSLVNGDTHVSEDKLDGDIGIIGNEDEAKKSLQSQTDLVTLEVTEPKKIFVLMDKDVSVTINYTIPCQKSDSLYVMDVQSSNNYVFIVKGNSTFEITCDNVIEIDYSLVKSNILESEDEVNYATNKSSKIFAAVGSVRADIHGVLLGIEFLRVKLERGSSDVRESINGTVVAEKSFSVGVLRRITIIDKAFRIIIAVIISLVMLGFGCGLNLQNVKDCIKKPIAPGIGLGCQYILMPLIGYTVARVVPIENGAITFGIFVCGVCPGGGASNYYAYLLGGDVDLSITMTLISNLAALGLMPLWIYTLGKHFVNEEFEIFIPYVNMLQSLAMLTVPLLIGVFVKYKFPKAAIKFVKILKPIVIVIMIILIAVGIYLNLYIFKLFRPEYIFAGALLPYCGYLLGGIVAAIFRQSWVRIKTIALETGMQQIGVAFIMMIMSFPPPLGDLSALAPAASGMMTPIPPLIITIPYLIYARCTRTYDVVPALIDRQIDVHIGGNEKEAKNKNNGEIVQEKTHIENAEMKPMINNKLLSV